MVILRRCCCQAVTYSRLSYLLGQGRKFHTQPHSQTTGVATITCTRTRQSQAEGQTRGVATNTRTRQSQVKGQTSAKHWYKLLLPNWKTQEQVLEELSKDILYEDDHIVALNKPNGLPMHALRFDAEYLPPDVPVDVELSVMAVKEALEHKLHVPSLEEVYGQPRLYSGIIVFTKSEKAFQRLKKYFVHVKTNRVFCQKFWGVTLGIPKEVTGDEKVALSRFHNGNTRLTIREKEASPTAKERRLKIEPSVQYTVLSQSHQSNTALLELIPTATKWDCLEVYLVSKLWPLLGDHTYSSRLKTVQGKPILVNPKSVQPGIQVFPRQVARRLELSTSDREYVPLHLHCQELTLPDLSATKKQNRTITIKAPLPDFFQRTLNCLDLESE